MAMHVAHLAASALHKGATEAALEAAATDLRDLESKLHEAEARKEQLKAESDKRSLLLDVAHNLGESHDVHHVFENVVNHAQTALNAEKAMLYIIDEIKNELWTLTSSDHHHGAVAAAGEEAHVTRIPIDKSSSIPGFVAVTGMPVNVEDVFSDPKFSAMMRKPSNNRSQSVICIPIFGPVSSPRVRGKSLAVASSGESKSARSARSRGETGPIIGVVQVINKRSTSSLMGADVSRTYIL